MVALKAFLQALFKSLSTILKVILLSRKSGLRELAGSETGRMIILGNGPSLNQALQDHQREIENAELLCVNHFAITDHYSRLKPKYYLAIAHDLFFDDVELSFYEASERLFHAMAEKTTWEMHFFMPHEARKYTRWRRELDKNPNIHIHYMNLTPVEGFTSFTHSAFRRQWGMPRPHNVMIPCMMSAMTLGFDEICLLGADHSWLKDIHVNEKNEALINNKHFYDDSSSKAKAFDKKGKGARTLDEILFTLMTAFKGYFTIRKYAESRKISIFNCTKNSYIDAFERKTLK